MFKYSVKRAILKIMRNANGCNLLTFSTLYEKCKTVYEHKWKTYYRLKTIKYSFSLKSLNGLIKKLFPSTCNIVHELDFYA